MANEKEALRREYVALIGYDPFEDDPSMTADEVWEIIADYKRTFVDADDDAGRYAGWHSMQSAVRDAW